MMNSLAKQNMNQQISGSGVFANVQVYCSPDRQYVFHNAPGIPTVSVHVNLYKKILGIPYQPKPQAPTPLSGTRTSEPFLGFRGNLKVRRSFDGKYLIHSWCANERIMLPIETYTSLLDRMETEPKNTDSSAKARKK